MRHSTGATLAGTQNIVLKKKNNISKRVGRYKGRNWVNLRGGRRYIFNRKDKMKHGLSPSVKCVAPLLDMSLAKECNAGGGAPPPVAPLVDIVYLKLSPRTAGISDFISYPILLNGKFFDQVIVFYLTNLFAHYSQNQFQISIDMNYLFYFCVAMG